MSVSVSMLTQFSGGPCHVVILYAHTRPILILGEINKKCKYGANDMCERGDKRLNQIRTVIHEGPWPRSLFADD